MYAHAIYRTVRFNGSQYILNVYNWVKTAVWDAPYRVYLDVELEKVSIERELSLSETNDDSKTS
jgi:hypothetical protein